MSVNPFTKIPIKDINVFEPCEVKKPVEQIKDILDEIRNDMDDMKKDISHIRDYIKKDMIKKQIEQDELLRQENEYVLKPKGWWFS